jgi:hypothetical protein
MRDAGVLANLSSLAVLANTSGFYTNPVGHALMAAAGARKRPAGDNDNSSDSRTEAVKKPWQVNAGGSPNDDDNDDKEDAQLEELVVVLVLILGL